MFKTTEDLSGFEEVLKTVDPSVEDKKFEIQKMTLQEYISRWCESEHGIKIDPKIIESILHISYSLEQDYAGDLKWEKINPDNGDLFTVEEFIEDVKIGGLRDSDGFGEYVKDGMLSNVHVYPSDVYHFGPIPGFTHIMWYNK